MTENKSTKASFTLPKDLTSATNAWTSATVTNEVKASERDAAFGAAIESSYPESLKVSDRRKISGAVAKLVAARKVKVNGVEHSATPADATRASKFVTMAWYRVGLKRSGVNPDTLARVTFGEGDDVKSFDTLRLVVNGEGGKPFADFRKAVSKAAEDGKFADIPALVENFAPAADPTPENDPEANDDENGAPDGVVTVGAVIDAPGLVALLAALAGRIDASAMEYNPGENERIIEALGLIESAVHHKTTETVAA